MINGGKHEYRGDRIGRGFRASSKIYKGVKVNAVELERAFEKIKQEKAQKVLDRH